MPFCSHCGAHLDDAVRYCSNCGASATGRPPSGESLLPAPGEAPSEGVAIIALLLNVLFLPGLGTLIAGRSEGWWQIGLLLGGLVLALTLVGILLAIPMWIAAWVWGIVSGVQALRDAQATARARGPAA